MNKNKKAPALMTAKRINEALFYKMSDPQNCWKLVTTDKHGHRIILGYAFKGTRYIYYCPFHTTMGVEGKQYTAELERQVNILVNSNNKTRMEKWKASQQTNSAETAEK